VGEDTEKGVIASPSGCLLSPQHCWGMLLFLLLLLLFLLPAPLPPSGMDPAKTGHESGSLPRQLLSAVVAAGVFVW
jgi:hypothetical protein